MQHLKWKSAATEIERKGYIKYKTMFPLVEEWRLPLFQYVYMGMKVLKSSDGFHAYFISGRSPLGFGKFLTCSSKTSLSLQLALVKKMFRIMKKIYHMAYLVVFLQQPIANRIRLPVLPVWVFLVWDHENGFTPNFEADMGMVLLNSHQANKNLPSHRSHNCAISTKTNWVKIWEQ